MLKIYISRLVYRNIRIIVNTKKSAISKMKSANALKNIDFLLKDTTNCNLDHFLSWIPNSC